MIDVDVPTTNKSSTLILAVPGGTDPIEVAWNGPARVPCAANSDTHELRQSITF